MRSLLEESTLLVEAKRALIFVLVYPKVIALPTGRTQPISKLALTLLTLNLGHFVIIPGGEAKQPVAAVTGQHGGLKAAETVVHLTWLEALHDCVGLALRAGVERVDQLALLAADVHQVLRGLEDVAEEDRSLTAALTLEEAFGFRNCDYLPAGTDS